MSTRECPLIIGDSHTANRRFGELLKGLRHLNEMTPQDLANMIGVHVSFIRGIERGAQAPSMRTAQDMLSCAVMPKNYGIEWLTNDSCDLALKDEDQDSWAYFKFKARIRGQNHRPEPDNGAGFWIAYHSDFSAFQIFDREVEALRYAVDNSMLNVKFLRWGQGRHDL